METPRHCGIKRKRQSNNAPRLTMSRRGLTASRTLCPANISTHRAECSTGMICRNGQNFCTLWGKGKPPVTAIVIWDFQHGRKAAARQAERAGGTGRTHLLAGEYTERPHMTGRQRHGAEISALRTGEHVRAVRKAYHTGRKRACEFSCHTRPLTPRRRSHSGQGMRQGPPPARQSTSCPA